MARPPRIGVLYSRVRVEEKWIFAAMERRGVDYERLDDRRVYFDVDHPGAVAPVRRHPGTQPELHDGLSALRVLNAGESRR
jgi:[lysine-biosynthesis-protein LysW]--L-2-aminoadipate ligase